MRTFICQLYGIYRNLSIDRAPFSCYNLNKALRRCLQKHRIKVYLSRVAYASTKSLYQLGRSVPQLHSNEATERSSIKAKIPASGMN